MTSRRWGLVVALAAGLLATAASAETMTLYTSQPEADASKTVAAFRKANPDIEVSIYRSGTSDILGKLAAEFAGGDPQPDALLIADAVSMETLKGDGRLAPYPGARLDGFPDGAYDQDRTYFGSKLITTGIAYNTGAPDRPEHWADLGDAKYKGLLVMPSPLYSGAATYLLSGFVERPELGWDYFKKLKSNAAVAERGNGAVLKAVASGEKPYGILVDFMALNAKKKGSPIDFVFPSEGVPAVTEPVAILKTAKHPEAARKFVDFILSDEGQRLALSQGYLPAKDGIGRPDWLPPGTRIVLMDISTSRVVKDTATDKQTFSDLFGG